MSTPRRLLAALGASALLLGVFTYIVYGAGLGQSAVAVAGSVILLGLALAVAWASNRGPEG